MKVFACFLLFGILACTDCAENQRSINLALETVLEFNSKDKAGDFKLLDSVQNFITKVKTVIDKNSHDNYNFRRDFRAPNVKRTFTDFIHEAVNILNTYEDTTFVDFFDILDKEFSNYHYRGCKFNELTENDEIRELVAAKLDLIKGKPASVIKSNINILSDMLKYEKYDKNIKNIVDDINSLYGQEDGEKFQKVLSDLEAYNKSKSNSVNSLGKIIKNGVRSVVFDHYTNLKTNIRKDFKHKVEIFWDKFKNSPPSRGNIPNFISESNMNDVMKSEPVSRTDLIYTNNEQVNSKIDVIETHRIYKGKAKMKPSDDKDARMKRDDVDNEKKRYKHPRRYTIRDPIVIQGKETRLLTSQERVKSKDQEQSIYIDSLSSESYSSTEYQEKQVKTLQYMATDKPSTGITKIIQNVEALNPSMRKHIHNTVQKIWIEESMGKLPQAVVDKLANKPGHKMKHNMKDESLDKHGHKYRMKHDKDKKKWHGEIYEPKLENTLKKKYDKKHESKYWSKRNLQQKSKQNNKHKNDNKPKPKEALILNHNGDFYREKYVRTTKSVSITEKNQYKKSLLPVRGELKQDIGSITTSRKARNFLDIQVPSKPGQPIKPPRSSRTAAAKKLAGPSRLSRAQILNKLIHIKQTQQNLLASLNNFSMRPLAHKTPLKTYPQRSKTLSSKPKRPSRSNSVQTSLSSEGMTLELFETQDDKENMIQVEPYSLRKSQDYPDVIKKINSLERQLNEVKRKNNVKIDDVKTKEVKYKPKENVVKRNNFETRIKAVNEFSNDLKVSQDKSKIVEAADNKMKVLTENVKDKNSKNKENNIERSKKSVTRFRSYVLRSNDVEDMADKTKVTETTENKTKVLTEDGSENNKKEYEKSKTSFRSDVNIIPIDFKNKTDKTMATENTDNEIKVLIKDKDLKNNENNVERGKMSEARFRTVVNMIPSDFKNRTDKIKPIELTENKMTFMKEHKHDETSKNKDEIVNNHHRRLVLQNKEEDKKTAINLTNDIEVTSKARMIVATRTSMKTTETTTNATTTVKPTKAITTPTTLELTKTVTIPVATSSKSPDVLKKVKINTTVDVSKNKLTNNTSQVKNNVNETTLKVTETHIMKIKKKL